MPIGPTQQVRTRTRSPQGGAATPAQSGGGWMKTGAAATQVSQQEIKRQQERANGQFMPFRFWTGIGESKEVVVLDAQLGPCFFEHNLQDRQGKWNVFETCPKEWEPCPLCEGTAGAKDSYYVMMLTVMDLTPYTNQKNVVIPHSRKLMPAKAGLHPFFMRQLERHGTLRGMQLLMSRDTKQTHAIGNPEFVELHSEDDIIAAFGHDPVVAQDGKVLKAKNADCFPFDYDKLFKKPSAVDLRNRYGGNNPAGSRQEEADVWGAEPADTPAESITADLDDEIPF